MDFIPQKQQLSPEISFPQPKKPPLHPHRNLPSPNNGNTIEAIEHQHGSSARHFCMHKRLGWRQSGLHQWKEISKLRP